MSKLRLLPFCLAMATQGYDIRSMGYTQCTGRGNESKPISGVRKRNDRSGKRNSPKSREENEQRI